MQRRGWRHVGVLWRPLGAAKKRARAEWRRGRRRRGGTGELRRRTGERPGGVVIQGGQGVEAAELGRRSGMVGDVDGARGRRRSRRRDGSRGDDGGAAQIKNCAQVLEEGGGRRDIYRGPPFVPVKPPPGTKRSFVPGRGSTWDKRCIWAGRENFQPAAHL